MILKAVRVILLLFSTYGYAQYFLSKLKLRAELVMPIILSLFGSVIFLAGILNILRETAALIFIVGIILVIISVKHKYNPAELITGGTVICALSLAALLLFTYGTKFTSYDNFSHWGTAVRLLVTKNRFPNFEDSVIYFDSYPLGSASLIFYFSKITGIHGEWFYIWVQQIVTVCCVGSLFVFCKKKRPLEYLACSIAVFCILFCTNGVNITAGIQVDTLLSALGIAGIAICFYYRENLNEKLFLLMPINIFSATVKNSGVFFTAIITLFCIYRIARTGKFKMLYSPVNIASLLSPFIVIFLWKKHVSFVFSEGMSAKHSVSVENYSKVFSEKTPEIISEISHSFLKKVFSFGNTFLIILIALLATLILLRIFKIKAPVYGEAAVLIIGSYIIYQLGNYFMYIFSMPNNEALTLACYDRYYTTIITFSAGVFWILFTEVYGLFTEKAACTWQKAVISGIAYTAAVSGIIWFSVIPNLNYLKKTVYAGSDRQILDSVAEKYAVNIQTEKSYAVIWEFDKAGYRYFVSRYVFNTGEITMLESNNLKDAEAKLRGCDFLVVAEHNKTVDAFLLQKFGSCNEDFYSLN